MKKLIFIFLSVLSMSSFSFDLIDLENILAEHGLSSDKLKDKGIGILFGELTGIGKSVDAQKLEGIIANHELILKGQIATKNFNSASKTKSISDLKSVSLKDGTEIMIGQSQGFLIKN